MTTMEDLTANWEAPQCNKRLSKEQAEDFSNKIRSFHERGFVHGDIRWANLLLRQKDQGDPCRVKLVDFEWSGKEGEIIYPACLTREGRPDGAVDGALILQEHDQEVVSGLMKYLTD